jgi:cellulose synthase/poly-beta-1,6-N-acetylglucosamine synthase-like glycosyltransferase
VAAKTAIFYIKINQTLRAALFRDIFTMLYNTPNNTGTPTVSVITPTWNREAFLPFIYRSFISQKEISLEWIVIDDSEVPSTFIASLNDPRVIYRHLPLRTSIGEKRNLAIDLARGEVIAHFDDDEIYAPNYIITMLKHMHNQRADLTKLSAFFLYSAIHQKFAYWDLLRTSGLHFRWDEGPMTALNFPENNNTFSDNYLGFGFSYLYTKQLWASQPFDSVSFNEDGAFAAAARARGARIALPADETGLCLHIVHDSNTSISFPQYLLPEILAERHLPYFCEMLNNMPLRDKLKI